MIIRKLLVVCILVLGLLENVVASTILGVGDSHRLWTRSSLSSPWVSIPNSGSVIDVTILNDGTILGIGDGFDLWKKSSLTSSWVSVPNSGSVISIDVLPDGTILGVGMSHGLWTKSTLTSPWVYIPDSKSVIAVTSLDSTNRTSCNSTDTNGSTAAGIAQCKANPASCGIDISVGTVTTVSGQVGTVGTNLDIYVPSLNYTTLFNTQNIWINLSFSHKESGKFYWTLKDYGSN